MTDRDTFAAAALTGLLSNIPRYQLGVIAVQAYDIADEMLAERSRTGQAAADTPPQPRAGTNHGAVPAARVPFRWPRTDKADLPEMDDTNHDAADEIERLRQFDRPQPIKTAEDTPDTHATPTEGSVQGEGTVPDSRTENEPVAWAVRYAHCDTGIVALLRTLDECRQQWINRTTDYWRYEPLYRHPPCQDSLQKNLTEAEHDALEFAVETGRVAMHDESTLRKMLERLHP